MTRNVSIEDHITTLEHSTLLSILVEGENDLFVYRAFDRLFGPYEVSIYPCGCKETVLRVQRALRKKGFNNTVAIVDADLWTLYGPPEDLSNVGVRTTTGYSVENDAIIFGRSLHLLTPREKNAFETELKLYASW
jgi:Protein of unknown function (DUF4435)